jgi:uncharacterized protein YecE (DUF72 family)
MNKSNIFIGTSGWSYKDWKSAFYPDKMAPSDYLSYYAQHFKTIEINTSFYHLPRTTTIAKWMAAVPADFFFCPKMSRYITHEKKLSAPAETLPRFFEVFEPMQKQLGPILIQLPPSLGFNEEIAIPFFETLQDRYGAYQFALEIRHPSWLDHRPIQMLEQHHISLVHAESGKRWIQTEIITDKNIYLRFHGPDGSYTTCYDQDVMESYAKIILDRILEGHIVWVFFNNTDHGYALQNARTFIELTNSL